MIDPTYRRADGSVVRTSAVYTRTMDASCWTVDGDYVGRVPLSELTPLCARARAKFRDLGIAVVEEPGTYEDAP